MNKNYFLLGIAGRANVGKDTAAKLINQFVVADYPQIKVNNIIVFSASKFLQEDVAKMTGGNIETIEKNKRITYGLRWILEQYGTNFLGDAEISKRMQYEIEEIIKSREQREPLIIIIPSIRSLHQRSIIKGMNGILLRIRCEREDSMREAYPSEKEIENLKPELIINNDWTLLRFEAMLLDLYRSELKPKINTIIKHTTI